MIEEARASLEGTTLSHFDPTLTPSRQQPKPNRQHRNTPGAHGVTCSARLIAENPPSREGKVGEMPSGGGTKLI